MKCPMNPETRIRIARIKTYPKRSYASIVRVRNPLNGECNADANGIAAKIAAAPSIITVVCLA